MPIIVKCKECGEIYYIGFTLVNINQIISTLETCRNCGRRFGEINDIDIEVSPLTDLENE